MKKKIICYICKQHDNIAIEGCNICIYIITGFLYAHEE